MPSVRRLAAALAAAAILAAPGAANAKPTQTDHADSYCGPGRVYCAPAWTVTGTWSW
jgi:hypothetical protein